MSKTKEASSISFISKFLKRKALVSVNRPRLLLVNDISFIYRIKKYKLAPTNFKIYAPIDIISFKFKENNGIMKLKIPLTGSLFKFI